jgi:hypothetical protein
MTRLHKHLEEVPASVCFPLFAAQDMMVETIKVFPCGHVRSFRYNTLHLYAETRLVQPRS